MATPKKTSSTKKVVKRTKTKTAPKLVLSQTARMLLASLVLVVFVIACLLVLTSLRDRLLVRTDVVVYEEPVREYQPTRQYDYDDIYRLVDLQLISGPQSQGWRRVAAPDGVDAREIFGSFPPLGRLTELAQHIEQTRAPARLDIAEPEGVVQLLWEGELQLKLIFQPPKPVDIAQHSRIAIIIDDLGPSLTTLNQFLDLGLPLTPSILPGSDRAGAAAELLRNAGREFLIHVPMEPRSYPQTNPGADALLLQHSEDDIRRWMHRYRDQVPGAVGMNNHMGSRFTEYAAPMQIVLDELKRQDLFFVDSVTISSSVAFAEARRMGLKTAARDIFLDNEEDVDYIRRQLRKMVQLAQKQREVIAIAHPYPETLEALRLEKDWLLAQPIDFVPASRLVKRYSN
jgi:polysaccharide deacetylase 2 family uncharacterized protein YibQ